MHKEQVFLYRAGFHRQFSTFKWSEQAIAHCMIERVLVAARLSSFMGYFLCCREFSAAQFTVHNCERFNEVQIGALFTIRGLGRYYTSRNAGEIASISCIANDAYD